MSNKLPCCYGCMLYGHAGGCTCPKPDDWPVTIRYSDAERIADGTETPAVRDRVRAAVVRVMEARFGVNR